MDTVDLDELLKSIELIAPEANFSIADLSKFIAVVRDFFLTTSIHSRDNDHGDLICSHEHYHFHSAFALWLHDIFEVLRGTSRYFGETFLRIFAGAADGLNFVSS